MRLDYDLVRELLLAVEKSPAGEPIFGLSAEGKSEAEVLEHLEVLVEAGLLDGHVQPVLVIKKLTWNGHQFLANARNDTVWNRAKQMIKEKAASAGLEVLTAMLKKAAAEVLGAKTE